MRKGLIFVFWLWELSEVASVQFFRCRRRGSGEGRNRLLALSLPSRYLCNQLHPALYCVIWARICHQRGKRSKIRHRDMWPTHWLVSELHANMTTLPLTAAALCTPISAAVLSGKMRVEFIRLSFYCVKASRSNYDLVTMNMQINDMFSFQFSFYNVLLMLMKEVLEHHNWFML